LKTFEQLEGIEGVGCAAVTFSDFLPKKRLEKAEKGGENGMKKSITRIRMGNPRKLERAKIPWGRDMICLYEE
jgi:hypothetical protein